jgi:hypothetical protein
LNVPLIVVVVCDAVPIVIVPVPVDTIPVPKVIIVVEPVAPLLPILMVLVNPDVLAAVAILIVCVPVEVLNKLTVAAVLIIEGTVKEVVNVGEELQAGAVPVPAEDNNEPEVTAVITPNAVELVAYGISPIAARVGNVKDPDGRTRVEPEALPVNVTAPVCTVKAVVKVAEFVNVKVPLPLIVGEAPIVKVVPAPAKVLAASEIVKFPANDIEVPAPEIVFEAVLIDNVNPSAIVSVDPVAGAVIVTLFIEVEDDKAAGKSTAVKALKVGAPALPLGAPKI